MTTSSMSTSLQPRCVPWHAGVAFHGLLDAVPAGLGMRVIRAHAQAWLLLCIVFLFTLVGAEARAATPPNMPITNTANVAYDLGGTTVRASGSVTVTTAGVTPASIRFLAYVPAAFASASGATVQAMSATECRAPGGNFTPMAAPTIPGVGPLPSPGSYAVAPTSTFGSSDAAFIEVTDYSANADPAVAERIVVTVTNPSGDSETLRLLESGPSTGVFIGYLPLRMGAVVPGDCRLEVRANDRLTATYIQPGTSAVSTSVALVDPQGLVFDSRTGAPVDGARVTLIDVATGQAAQVFGDDGVSAYPSSVLTGSTVTDSGGTVYALSAGYYQFPRVNAPGTYRLQVDPPLGYKYPSQVADPALQQLPTAPFQLSASSRGAPFNLLPGPPVRTDVPLDPAPLGTVDITKTAGKSVVGIGDFVPYIVTLSTSSEQPLPGVQLQDRLPPGFRYQKGSARLNGAAFAEPQVAPDGRTLLFTLGTIARATPLSLTYLTAVGPSASVGPAQNTAQTVGRIASNVASAAVIVREDLNRSRAILMGQVTVAPSCEADSQDRSSRRPVRGARILLQDGTYVITDQDGNWHVDNVRRGTHVVQLDTETLPAGMQLRSCEDNTRTGGRDYSQFVNVRGGTLWRADFRLAPVASCLRQHLRRAGRDVDVVLGASVGQDAVSATLLLPAGISVDPASVRMDGQPTANVQVGDGFVVLRDEQLSPDWQRRFSLRLLQEPAGDLKLMVRTRASGGADSSLQALVLPAHEEKANDCAALPVPGLDHLRPERVVAPANGTTAPASPGGTPAASERPQLIEQLPYDDKWLAAAKPGFEWLHPQASFQPALPIVKVAIKHLPTQVIELRINGRPVDPMRHDGIQLSPDGQLALSNWRAVELKDGSNVLEVSVRDAQGQVVTRETREIHYGVMPARVELDVPHSRLVADGRTSPLVAVRLLDPQGKPIRRGAIGEFTIEQPYAPQQQADGIQREPLAGAVGGRAKYETGDDGVALIPLRPTSQSGEAVLRFDLGNGRTAQVRAWLQADQREWVLVGFAEGTAGHKSLAGNLEALKDGSASEQLFDQNRIAFYAKGMVKGEYLLTAAYDTAKEKGTGVRPLLRQTIDPNAYYTLYGDATQQQYDATSVRNLYLKIEKKQFYLLFGDFNTGLTVTELGRYSRTVNGVKSEYRGETLSYNTFATRTAQAYLKDEIQGDGTSGLYRLRGRDIVPNSDKVRVEVRDRFRPDQVVGTRALTPWLDYQIDYVLGTLLLREPLTSRDLELNPQLLVVEYESAGGAGEAWTYGGRAAVQVGDRTTVGATRIHEGDIGRQGTLTAGDATVKISDTTRARVEVASSNRQSETGPQSGNAYVAEIQHDDGSNVLRGYAREQQPGFGLGQQSAIAQGQRRIGVEGRSKISEILQVQGEVSRAQDLASTAARDVVEGRAVWQATDAVKLQAGARVISESDGQGGESTTQQVTAGVAYQTAEQRLVLRASTDLDVGSHGDRAGVTSYPNRFVLGADYKLSPAVTLTAQHELAQADGVRVSTSSVGLRTQPWSGAELKGSMGSQGTTDSDRLFASLGLVQRWKLDDQWSVDAGLEQTHTLAGGQRASALGGAQVPATGVVPVTSPFASTPSGSAPASGLGLVASDFTAVSAGVAYRDTDWSGNARIEWRGSEIDTKLNVLLGLQRRLGNGQAVAAGLQVTNVRGAGLDSERANARGSYVWRPDGSDWTVLERLDYVQESSPSVASRLFTRKLINNLNANWKPHSGLQVAVQYGAKYVREMLQDTAASGYTDLVGLEGRYDLTPVIDIGLHLGMLRAHAIGARSYQAGASVGYRLATNTWVSVGYNVAGFWDADFAGAEYRAKGVYLNVRAKFDQNTFDLNDRKTTVSSLRP